MKLDKKTIRDSLLLYAISDKSMLSNRYDLVSFCEIIIKSGVSFLQLRDKNANPEEFKKEILSIKKICNRFSVPLVINDDIEMAIKTDAHGVHLGQEDIKNRDVRYMIGSDKILGISARTIEEAITAQKMGADYIGVGAVFKTGTKENAKPIDKKTFQNIVNSIDIPVVAIGGISIERVKQLEGYSLDGIAVISAIFNAENPEKACKDLLVNVRNIIKKSK